MNCDPQSARQYGRWSLAWLSILIVFWSIEILIMQHVTTCPAGILAGSVLLKDAARRMVLNVAACTVAVCLLNRWALYAVFGLGVLVSTALVLHADYFQAPLSWHVVTNQWHECYLVADHLTALIPWRVVLLLGSGLVVKTVLREAARKAAPESRPPYRPAMVAAVVYVAMAVGLAGVHKPIHTIKMGSPEYIYGYLVGWSCEAIFFDDQAFLDEALVQADSIKSDHLTPAEPLPRIGSKLAIVQVESLDFDVMDARVDGQPVMPFLHRLKQQAMLYRVQPIKITGSSDADFTLLATAMPNGKIPPYKVKGFPWERSLPWAAGRNGYAFVALHGYWGSFFHRREAYEQMGFSEIYFAEDLQRLGHRATVNGVEDDDVLQFSAKKMNATDEPTIHLVITYTSHGPFNRLPESKRELYPKPSNLVEAYLNSMRYVDRSLQRYFKALPKGTTLAIYGDHASCVAGYGVSDVADETVPWLICRKGENLAERQATRGTRLAERSKLNQLDMATYLRHGIEQRELASRPSRPR